MNDLPGALARALNVEISRLTPVAGGDINQAFCATLGSGRRVFVKSHAAPPQGMFKREAQGLAWLADGGARVPEVLAIGDGETPFLCLEWIEAGRPGKDHDTRLGEMLARLHATQPATFGALPDNFIGPLPQSNAPRSSWPDFYADCRLSPQIRLASDARALDAHDVSDLEAIAERLHRLLGPPEPPARLHGDLWIGNVMASAKGPVLVDPACYAGHREMDLAMLALFGHVSAALLEGYEGVQRLAPGFRERVGLCQLYPLLVHVNLFGGGYRSQLMTTVRRYL